MEQTNKQEKHFQRFGLQFRSQHLILMLSTMVLILTGIPLWSMGKPEFFWWNSETFAFLGGIEGITRIHRCSAVALVILSAYHMFYSIFTKEGRREFFHLLPKFKDVIDVTQNSLYFLGLSKKSPRFDRYSYIEKFDYWAVYWGCVIMIGSGLALLFPETAEKLLPGLTYGLAAEIHAGEALLAALAIFVWHFYNVHYNPSRFPGSLMWLHGKISEDEMINEHPVEYEKLMRKNIQEAKPTQP